MGVWSGRCVLVTGAAGFIGSHLTEALVRAGAEVRALARYTSNGGAGWLDDSDVRGDVEVVFGDVRDGDVVAAAIRGVDVVFHLAALIGIPYSYVTPLAYVRTNVEGTLNVLEGARHQDVARIVVTSTSEVYGTAQTVPINESHPLQGQSPYSASKIGADKIAESYHRSFGLPVATIRPFNTFGPRQSSRAVIPTIIAQLLRGPRVELGRTDPTRDFTYVTDTVKGFLAVGSHDEAVGRVTNVGNGRDVSIGEVASLIAQRMNSEIAIVSDQDRVRPDWSEVQRLVADATLARKLGWSPSVSLEEGIDRVIDWMRENTKGYRTTGYAL